MSSRSTGASTTDRGRSRQRAVLGRLLALGLLLALSAAACGGGGSESGAGGSTGGSSSPRGGGDADDPQLAFARCMRENGINMPDPSTSGRGPAFDGMPDVNDESFKRAEAACAKHMQGLGLGGPGGAVDPEATDRMVKLAQCMRQRGFNIPDPQTSGSVGGQGQPQFDINDPEFKKAERECTASAGLPQPGQGGSTRGRSS